MATDTNRAAELVADAFATEQDYFTMDDVLGELDMCADFEPDARLRNQRDSDTINYYGNLDLERRGVINLGPEGLLEAMTVDFDEPLRMLARTVVDQHRALGTENVRTLDLHQDYPGVVGVLPRWDIYDPTTANVQRGLIAGRPDELYVIRGGFNAHSLLTMVWSQFNIETSCSINCSVDCDPSASPPNARGRSQKVWAVFTVPVGEYLVYFTTCASCYFSFWHQIGESTNFDVIDPAEVEGVG